MKRLSFNVVRVAEFAWSRMEPTEGKYDFQWLLDALDLLQDHGISAIVCTPTATPPIWLLEKHPEIGYVDPDGYQHKHGARQHASYNNHIFRKYSLKITDAMLAAIAHHPSIIGWQTDNELGSHQQRCLSTESTAAWQRWLEKRYGNIEHLNRSWNTVVWSQHYQSFDQVPPPYKLCYYTHNFALTLNYRRFMADSIAEFQMEHIEIIRRHTDAPITHNSTALTDDWRLSRALDFASSDLYTGNQSPTAIQFRFDSFRNLLPGRRYWTMETSCEDQMTTGELYAKGWLGCFSFLNYTMGGNGLCFWPWKQQPGGSEIINSAIVHANGQPSSGWMNVEESTEVKNKLDPILKDFKPSRAEAVLVRSEVNGRYFFADAAGGLEPNYDYNKRLREYYQTLLDIGLWRDIVFDESDLPNCKLLLTPYLPHLSDRCIEQALALVENGTVWIAGPYSGFRTQDHGSQQTHLLGSLEERIGFHTRFLIKTANLEVDIGGRHGATNQFATVFEAGAQDEVIGVYTSERFNGMPWGLRRPYGKGAIYLPGSELDEPSRRAFLLSITKRESIFLYPAADEFTLTPLSEQNGREAWALCNYGSRAHTIDAPSKQILASSKMVIQQGDQIQMPAKSWAIAG